MILDIECNTIWTKRSWNDGEGEKYHSKIKMDIDVERFLSGKLDANELVLELTVLAYNILRLIGRESLKSRRAPKSKHSVKRHRIRTIISNLLQIAGHVTTHRRRVVLVILSILVYTFFSRMFDLMLPLVVKHSIAVV